MGTWSWDRLASAGGIVGVVLFVVGFLVVGDQPGIGDPAADIAGYFEDDRGRVLFGATLLGLSAAFFLWFVGAVANRCREAGQGRLAATTIAAGSVSFAVILVLVAVQAALAHGVAEAGEEGAVAALYYVSWTVGVLLSFPMALLFGAASAGLARGGVLPGWFEWFGTLAALLMALGGTVWARDGFWAPDGGYGFITVIVFVVWVVVASALLSMRTTAASAPERAPAPPV